MSAQPIDYRFISYEAAAKRFGISPNAISVLAVQRGFPVFSRKIQPALMQAWLLENKTLLRDLKVR